MRRSRELKNGSTRLGYKPKHAIDLDTGVIVAAPIHPADQGDTTYAGADVESALENLTGIGLAQHPRIAAIS